MVVLHNSDVMIIGGKYLPSWPGPDENVIIYNSNSSSFTAGPKLYGLYEDGLSCTLFYSKSHDLRPVVFMADSHNAKILDYTVADSWKQCKFIFQKFDLT